MKKNILALQISSVIGDFKANCDKISSLLDDFYVNHSILDASLNKPDILFLPELWTVGWDCDVFQNSIKDNKNTIAFLSNIAKKYCVNVIGGSYLRITDDGIKNSCPILNRTGEVLGFYDKIHLYSPDGEAKTITQGFTPIIVDIEGLKIGLSICYDIRFPELFRSYIASSYVPDMLVNLSAWPKSRRAQYNSMAKSRAIENQSYFLALSQTGLIKNNIYNSGFSAFIDPLGETIVNLNEDESYIFATVDTAIVKTVRETYPNLKNKKVQNFGFNPEIVKVEVP